MAAHTVNALADYFEREASAGKSLFRDVDARVYNENLEQLLLLRREYPDYRDDQLLMYMLCSQSQASKVA